MEVEKMFRTTNLNGAEEETLSYRGLVANDETF